MPKDIECDQNLIDKQQVMANDQLKNIIQNELNAYDGTSDESHQSVAK